MNKAFPGTLLAVILMSGCATRESRDVKHEVEPLYSASAPTFKQATGSILQGGSYTAGNNITTLVNGREIFPPMLAAIRAAKRTINFETYVYWNGEIARHFADALAERARAGVQVNIILDAQGTGKMGGENLEKLRAAGVRTVKYHPLAIWDPRRYNNRTHRKLLIVDGKVGFIGGVGIADVWVGKGDTAKQLREQYLPGTG